MVKFKEFLNEGKGQLDISIQAAGKYLTTNKKIEEFLYSPVVVEHKTDGVKVTAIKIANKGTIDDWILAYKGNILYDGEFDFGADSSIKGKSIGASQFKFVIDHFKEVSKKGKSIPVGTELFIEYLMRKMTLSSDYTRKHGMILIGHSMSTYKEKNGKLITKPSGFDTSKRDEYANTMDLDTPAVLFEGVLGEVGTFERGIKNKTLAEIFKAEKVAMNWDNNELLVDDIRNLFLAVESKYGGKEEGVVIKFGSTILKFQQEYQLDKEARRQVKLKYQSEDPEVETRYWNDIRRLALEVVTDIPMKSTDKLKDLVKEIAFRVKTMKIDIKHPKRIKVNFQDDIQLTAKGIIMRKLKGNNNALILGRFQPLTLGHQKMIDLAYKECDDVYICLVKSAKENKESNPFSLELQEKMLKIVYPKINILTARTGNLNTIMNKIEDNINWIYAGTDRVKSYENQLSRNPDVKVREIERSDEDISATKVRMALRSDDRELVRTMTDEKLDSIYNELLSEL
jgi:cytidyltransferase-like protein